LVLAIERNQQNQINLSSEDRGETNQNTNGSVKTIVDEYKELALCDIFKSIVANLIHDGAIAQE
jgi:hypothetical protein